MKFFWMHNKALLVRIRRRSCACVPSTSGTASWLVRSFDSRVPRRTRRCVSSADTSSLAMLSRAFMAPAPGTRRCLVSLFCPMMWSSLLSIQVELNALIERWAFFGQCFSVLCPGACRRSGVGRIKCPYCPVEMDPNSAIELHVWQTDRLKTLSSHLLLTSLCLSHSFIHSWAPLDSCT